MKAFRSAALLFASALRNPGAWVGLLFGVFLLGGSGGRMGAQNLRSASHQTEPPSDEIQVNLVARWPCDQSGEASVLQDSTTNGLHGTMSQFFPEPFVEGAFSNALYFSEWSQVRFQTGDPRLNLGNGFTISVWFLGTDAAEGLSVVRWSDVEGNVWQLGVATNGAAHLQFMDPASNAEAVANEDAPVRVLDGRWHHLAGVYDPASATAALYVDGELEAVDFSSNWNPSEAASFLFGCPADVESADDSQMRANAPFLLDEARLYGSVLGPEQILELLNPPDDQGAEDPAANDAQLAQSSAHSQNHLGWANPADSGLSSASASSSSSSGTTNFCPASAMRAAQERYYAAKGSYYSWPARSYGPNGVITTNDVASTNYPPDDFYCYDLANIDYFEVSLVQSLASALSDDAVLNQFVTDTNIEGQAYIHVHSKTGPTTNAPFIYDGDMPAVTGITCTNYFEKLSVLTNYIGQLKSLWVGATVVSNEARSAGPLCVLVNNSGPGSPSAPVACESSKVLCATFYASASWTSPGSAQGIQFWEYTCTIGGDPVLAVSMQ